MDSEQRESEPFSLETQTLQNENPLFSDVGVPAQNAS